MLSIIIPASNEEAWIGSCLEAVLRSDGPERAEVIIVANGCEDDTVAVANSFRHRIGARGWRFVLLDLTEGGKANALNAGDMAAQGTARVYLDADVVVDSALLAQLYQCLSTKAPTYASGHLKMTAQTAFSRAYARIWAQVPFMAKGVPGAGVFAVNAAGRDRWGDWPAIISDDTFARLQFASRERLKVQASYEWPVVEGFSKLVRVRRRQDRGVVEISDWFPELLTNDDKQPLGILGALRLALRDPMGFAAYASVALAVRLGPGRGDEWRRGR